MGWIIEFQGLFVDICGLWVYVICRLVICAGWCYGGFVVVWLGGRCRLRIVLVVACGRVIGGCML